MDYSLFDSLIDSVFVIDENKCIHYCNEPGAALLSSSVPRLIRKKPAIHELLKLADERLFVMPKGDWGKEVATPLTEVAFEILGSGKSGKLQVSIQPFTDIENQKRWSVLIRDTTLEEVLHAKYHAQLEAKEGVIAQLKEAQEELEQYSKNLEKMVEVRTAEIRKINVMLAAIMNSLGQGFLTFDRAGFCSDVYTRACEDILEKIPAKRTIWEVLNLDGADKSQFQMWMQAIFDETLPFDTLKELGPNLYHHSLKKYVTLDYFPIRASATNIDNLVVVATDRTAEHEANLALERERQNAKLIMNMVRNKGHFIQFLKSVDEYLEVLTQIARVRLVKDFDYAQAFRLLHTLEGEAGAFSAQDLRMSARAAQEIIEPLKDPNQNVPDSILKDFSLGIDSLKQAHANFLRTNYDIFKALRIGDGKTVEIEHHRVASFLTTLRNAGVKEGIYRQFFDDIMRQPLVNLMAHFDEVANMIAKKEGKLINPIHFTGDHVKVFPESFQPLIAAMVHVIRNSVDHGIETSENRNFSGKSDAGQIEIKVERVATKTGPWVQIIVQDDGAGIDPEVIRSKLKKRMGENFKDESNELMIQHIFDAGLSTRDSVGQFSGRGIGMDAVKHEVVSMGGDVWVDSTKGQGTTITLRVPEKVDKEAEKISA